MPFFSTD